MTLLFLTILPFAVSLTVCWLMIRFGPQDAPDGDRKTQIAPVPSAGGIGIFAGVLAAATIAFLSIGNESIERVHARLLVDGYYPLSGFVLLCVALGFADDKLSLPALPKLAVLVAGAVLVAVFGPRIDSIWLPLGPGDVSLPAWLSIAAVAIWLVVMTNAVNFMDGANGIAMGASAIMLAAITVVLLPEIVYGGHADGVRAAAGVSLAAICAIAGFLVWNLAGRLFAGDTGALGIGALLGVLGVVLADRAVVWVAPAFMLPFLVDVLMTLAWRARAGRPLLKAHRDHAYQLLLRSGWPHLRVAMVWWGFSAACAVLMLAGPFAGAIGLLPVSAHPADLAGLGFAGLTVTGILLWIWQRRTLGRRLAAEGR